MMKLLAERGHYFTTMQERRIVGDMKEKNCYIALGYDNEMKSKF